MSEPEKDFPALAKAQRRRADIHHALIELEAAVSSPAPGREEDWARGVITSLGTLRETIEEHIEVTESSGGLYDEVLRLAPRLSGAVARLREEHPAMREATSELIARLRTADFGPSFPLDDTRDALQRLLGQIVKHRQHGADLVWEAYNLDIGGID